MFWITFEYYSDIFCIFCFCNLDLFIIFRILRNLEFYWRISMFYQNFKFGWINKLFSPFIKLCISRSIMASLKGQLVTFDKNRTRSVLDFGMIELSIVDYIAKTMLWTISRNLVVFSFSVIWKYSIQIFFYLTAITFSGIWITNLVSKLKSDLISCGGISVNKCGDYQMNMYVFCHYVCLVYIKTSISQVTLPVAGKMPPNFRNTTFWNKNFFLLPETCYFLRVLLSDCYL